MSLNLPSMSWLLSFGALVRAIFLPLSSHWRGTSVGAGACHLPRDDGIATTVCRAIRTSRAADQGPPP